MIPVYTFLNLPIFPAIRQETTRFLERTARLQWGLMLTVYCISHAPALLLLTTRSRCHPSPLERHGWTEALRAIRPERVIKTEATVGDLIAELKAKADLKPQTLEGYAKAPRKIVADVFEIGGGNEKCDYRGGGYQACLEKVHAVKLAELTPERVQAWKRAFLSRAG